METSPRTEFCLHSWGANSYGQLGQGHVEDQSAPRLADITPLQNTAVRAVSGGGGHSVVITENAEVFVCGQNHRGQLGLGHCVDILTFQLCCSLSQRITKVACGWDFTLLLTDCGQVFACGSNAFGQLGVGETVKHSSEPLVVESLKESVVSVAAGLRHSLAASDSGCVYQWGRGLCSHAKRALSPHPVPSHLNSTVPSVVPGLDQKTHMVSAGSVHCVCLTGDGDVFLWGSNKHGQLTSTEPFLSSPSLMKRSLLGGEKVVHVWSGWTHIVAQTETGRVFTWGRGDYGQLGQKKTSSIQNPEQESVGPSAGGPNKKAFLPTEVKALHGAAQIACGSEHNLAIVGGSLLSWGWNEHGMCGDGSQTDVLQPQLVSGLKPLLIGCGAGHSMAVCAEMTDSRQNSAMIPLQRH